MALRSTGGIVLPKTKNPSKDEILLYDCPALAEIRLPELCAPVVEKGTAVSKSRVRRGRFFGLCFHTRQSDRLRKRPHNHRKRYVAEDRRK